MMFSYMNRGRSFYRDMVRLAIPLIIQNVITSSLALIDTVMIGRLGQTALAGVAMANIPIFVILLVVFGVQSGSSVLMSQYWGKGDRVSINRILGIGFYLAGGIGLIFGVTMLLIPQQFMALFGNDPVVIDVAARYIQIVGFSYFFDSLTQVYVGLHRSTENPKLGMYILSVSMVVNTFLNWVLIFGNLGFDAMGVEGGATATLVARMVGFGVMVLHAMSTKHFRIDLRLCARPTKELVDKFVRYSSPVIANETLWGFGCAMFPTIMGYMTGSEEILAAYALVGNFEKLITVAVFAVAGSAAIIIGREIGAGRIDEIYEVGATLNTVALLVGLVVGGIVILLIKPVLEPFVYPYFGLSEGAMTAATIMLGLYCFSLFARSYNCCNIVGVLRGGGDARYAAVLDVAPLLLFSVPMAALAGLVLDAGIFWVYVAVSADNIIKSFWGFARFKSGKWINDVTALSE